MQLPCLPQVAPSMNVNKKDVFPCFLSKQVYLLVFIIFGFLLASSITHAAGPEMPESRDFAKQTEDPKKPAADTQLAKELSLTKETEKKVSSSEEEAKSKLLSEKTEVPHDIPLPTDSSKKEDASAKGSRGESLINQARVALKIQDVQKAEELFLKALNFKITDTQRRDILLELGIVYEKMNLSSKLAIVYERFLKSYPDDPVRPQIYIRLGRLYRDIGAYDQAIARFYNVLNISLNINTEQMTLYRYLTLKAQLEIADTYFIIGDYEKSIKLFSRLEQLDLNQEERERLKFKTAYSFYYLENYPSVMKELEGFLNQYPNSKLAPEAHFILANTYKILNRNNDAVKEVMELIRYDKMQTPELKATWLYWKRKAANDLANDFYEKKDFMSALKIYQAMTPISSTPEWQWPIIYQIGLCFERLQMYPKAKEAYTLIINNTEWKDKKFEMTDALKDIKETAAWRLEHLNWVNDTEAQVNSLINPNS